MPDKRIDHAELERNQIGAGLRALMDELHEMAAEAGYAEAHSLKLADLTPSRQGVPECALEFAARRGVLEITERPDGATISPRADYQRKTARITGADGLSPEQAQEKREEQKAKELARLILRRLSVEPDHIVSLSKLQECVHHPAFSRALTGLYEAGVITMVKARGDYLVRLAVNPDLSPEPEIPEEPEDEPVEIVERGIIADRVDQDGEWNGGELGEWEDPLD